ncbi:MAG: Rne/Rng family ribonuclease [bacterium]
MFKQVLINVEEKDIRIAILEDGNLAELFVEQFDDRNIVGNVYKGKIEGIVPGLQAAFVNIGLGRNAFLHFADIRKDLMHPSAGGQKTRAKVTRDKTQDSLIIEPDSEESPASAADTIKIGQEILVQVVKDEIGDKGCRITTYVSLPGRYLVMMPFSPGEGGVSRKIEDITERKRLRKILSDLSGNGAAFIIRTAGLEQDEGNIKADGEYLRRQWMALEQRARRASAPQLIHDDHDILYRLVRDVFSEDMSEIYIDSEEECANLKNALEQLLPSMLPKVRLESASKNLFERFEVEKQFQKALRRKVWLKSGGYVVFDEAEALTAIDVNTGKFVGKEDQEKTILRTNMEACRVITQQIRLRDIGGLLVIDFIDMGPRENQRQVLHEFQRWLKEDRAKTTTAAHLSDFGLLEMTRKRVRQSLKNIIFEECPYCQGSGRVLSPSQVWKTVKYEMIKRLEDNPSIAGLEITLHNKIRKYLEEQLLESVQIMVKKYSVRLNFKASDDFHIEQFSIETTGTKTAAEVRKAQRAEPEKPAAQAPSEAAPESSEGVAAGAAAGSREESGQRRPRGRRFDHRRDGRDGAKRFDRKVAEVTPAEQQAAAAPAPESASAAAAVPVVEPAGLELAASQKNVAPPAQSESWDHKVVSAGPRPHPAPVTAVVPPPRGEEFRPNRPIGYVPPKHPPVRASSVPPSAIRGVEVLYPPPRQKSEGFKAAIEVIENLRSSEEGKAPSRRGARPVRPRKPSGAGHRSVTRRPTTRSSGSQQNRGGAARGTRGAASSRSSSRSARTSRTVPPKK